VPVIFMTGLTESEHVIEGFEVGGVDYVRKPVNVHESSARVRVHMGHARAVQASTTGSDATGRSMMATDTRGFSSWCTPMAEQAINRVEPGWSKEDAQLPVASRSTVERSSTRKDARGASVRLEQGDSASESVSVAQYRENEVSIRSNESNPQVDVARLQARSGSTDREAEVSSWISYGKSN
ncbi:hypothetical protein OY671_010215, partial [Metschnikowia pulcherrima]